MKTLLTSWLKYKAVEKVLRGSVGGVGATVVMTGVVALAHVTGLMRTPPPKEITRRAGQKAGVDPAKAPQPAFHATWLAAHVGYGATSGVMFSVVRPFLPSNSTVAGFLYGMVLWAVSYLGLMPALGLYPPPEEDSTSRTVSMIVAHAVYGVSLGEAEERVPHWA